MKPASSALIAYLNMLRRHMKRDIVPPRSLMKSATKRSLIRLSDLSLLTVEKTKLKLSKAKA